MHGGERKVNVLCIHCKVEFRESDKSDCTGLAVRLGGHPPHLTYPHSNALIAKQDTAIAQNSEKSHGYPGILDYIQ